MSYPAFRDKGSKLCLPCGTRDRVCKSGTVPDVSDGWQLCRQCTKYPFNPTVLYLVVEHRKHVPSVILGVSSIIINI